MRPLWRAIDTDLARNRRAEYEGANRAAPGLIDDSRFDPVYVGSLRRGAAGRLVALSVPEPASPEEVGEDQQCDESNDTVTEGLRDREQLAPVLSEDVPDQRVRHGPHDRSRQVIREKPVVPHSGYPGEERGHAAQTRSEASDKDGLPTVRLEVAFHPGEAPLADQEMEEPHLEDAVDQGPPADAPDPVHGVV